MHRGRLLPTEWTQPTEITTYLEWVQERGGLPTTLRIYRGRLNHTAHWLHERFGVSLLEATPQQLQAWRSALRLSRRTVILYVTVIKGFYEWAHRRKLRADDPAWDLPMPRARKSIPRPIDTGTLIVAIEGAPPMIRLWLILAAFCGLRAVEIAGLRREDVRSGDKPYLLIEGKGNKERIVPIAPQVWNELLLYGMPARGEIFRRKDGLPFTASHLDKLANDYLHDMGIQETLHQLRHWFGTRGQEEIGDLAVVGEVMGHASQNTTKGYAAASQPKARAMVEAIQLDPWPTRPSNIRT